MESYYTFYHKLYNYLDLVKGYYDKKEKYHLEGIVNKVIKDSEEMFKSWLRIFSTKKSKFEIPAWCTSEKLGWIKEISDFDWTDREKFEKFYRLMDDEYNFHNPPRDKINFSKSKLT